MMKWKILNLLLLLLLLLQAVHVLVCPDASLLRVSILESDDHLIMGKYPLSRSNFYFSVLQNRELQNSNIVLPQSLISLTKYISLKVFIIFPQILKFLNCSFSCPLPLALMALKGYPPMTLMSPLSVNTSFINPSFFRSLHFTNNFSLYPMKNLFRKKMIEIIDLPVSHSSMYRLFFLAKGLWLHTSILCSMLTNLNNHIKKMFCKH